MNVEIGTETPIFLFWKYLFRNFGILSLQFACPHCRRRIEEGYTLHVHTAGSVDGYTMYVHTGIHGLDVHITDDADGYTLHVTPQGGDDGYTYTSCTSCKYRNAEKTELFFLS
jgi:hypothetical protein